MRPDRFEQVLEWARAEGALPDGEEALQLEAMRPPPTGDLNRHPVIIELIASIARGVPADEMLERAWAIDLIALPVSAFEDMPEMAHFRETHQFVNIDHEASVGGELSFPRSPVHDPRRPVMIRRAPRLGEHDDEIFAELGIAPATSSSLERSAGS